MKNSLLFFAFSIFAIFALKLNAQVNLVDENFDGATMPSNWFTYNLGDAACDSENWTFGSGDVPGSGGNFSTNAAIFDDDSYGSDGDHNKSALYMGSDTLGFDLSSYGAPITLYYDYALYLYTGGGVYQTLSVAIWDNTASSWITLKTYDTDADPTADSVDIWAAIQNNPGVDPTHVYIGFIYDDISGSWGYGAGVDNVRLEVYNPPANDDCANATDISGIEVFGDYISPEDASGATGGNVNTCTDAMNDGVWYYFQSLYTGNVTVTVDPDDTWDAQIGIYTGSCGALNCVGTVDDGWSNGEPETITFPVQAGNDYYINAGHYYGSSDEPEGPFDLSVSFDCGGTAPANDLIDNAIEVTGNSFTDTVNTACSNAETGDFMSCDFSFLKTVFYKFHCTASSTVTATITNPEGFYTAAPFYTAPSLNATEADLDIVAQTNNPCSLGSVYSITTTAGQDYYVVLTNGANNTTITINGVVNNTGVSDQVIEGLSMYPNPVSDELTINAPENMKEISVFNITGQEIMHINPDLTNTTLSTADWATGTYIVKVMTEDKVGIYHIMKE